MDLGLGIQSAEEQLLGAMVQSLDEVNFGWERYIDPDPVHWLQTNFYIPELTGPIELYPYQVKALKEALSRDENGLFRYSMVVWGDLKKSAKTSLAAGVASWFMWQRPWSSSKIIGADLKQADSRQHFYMRRAIELNPEMKAMCKIVNYKIRFPNHSVAEAIPIDPGGEAGANDDFVSYTEIWSWKSKAHKKLWTESTLSPLKYGRSVRWADTYAGENGEAPILEQLYHQGVKEGEQISDDPPMYRNGRLFVLWNTIPRLPWQTEDYYRQESQTLTPEEFLRVHRNQWVSSSAIFVPIEWWKGCQVESLPPLDPDTPVVVALDAGIENDCFAIIMVSGWGDGKYAVRYSRAWYAPKNGSIHFRTDEKDGPEDELRRLIDRYNVIEVCFDPFQLKDLAERFSTEQIANMTEFGQQGPRLQADKQLFDMIRDRSVVHAGDSDLVEHITNANRKSEGDKLRIIKRAEHLKIDLAVALSMAVDRARSWGL